MAASSLYIPYKTLLGETGCIGNPYFYLLVAYASSFLIHANSQLDCLWLPTPHCAAPM